MKTKGLFSFAAVTLFLSLNVDAQPWSGSTTSTGNIYRTGKVGIGTTSPVSALEFGTNQWLKFNSSSNAGILFREDAHSHTATSVQYGAKIYYDASNDMLKLSTMQDNVENIGVSVRRDWPAVGIGKFTNVRHIGSALNVKGRSNDAQLEIGNSTTYDGNYILSYDRVASAYKNLVIRTTADPTMTFLTSGKVGIGTTSPGAKLHVNGSMYLNGKISFYYEGSYYNGITNNSHGDMTFNVGPTAPIMKLTSNSVSIGCSSSGNLNVNGKIQAKELEIKSGPCSDYVFESSYSLMSLNDVESYVKQNKHLPEVPSAKEFEENGYSVGEMDDILLRKVEELTLYVIELQKQIRELKGQE